jgi:hypothetical protein
MSRRADFRAPQQQAETLKASAGLLQRKCACGAHAHGGAECEACAGEGRKLGRAAVSRAETSDARPYAQALSHSAPGFAHDLSRIPSRSGAPVTLQPKLNVNAPGDTYEQEADRIAEQLTATHAHTAVEAAPPRVQRSTGQPNERAWEAPAGFDPVSAGAGSPLEPALRRDMEQHFGRDFGRVRVHTGARAAESAEALGARAYTVGRDVVFGGSQYAPGTAEGRRLLAHELTHVLQQGSGAVSPPTIRRQPDPKNGPERELSEKEARLAGLQRRIQDLSDDFVRLQRRRDEVASLRKRRADERAARTEANAGSKKGGNLDTLNVLRRVIKVEQTQTTIRFVATIQITFLGLSEKDGSSRAAAEIPNIAQAIRDAWTIGVTEGEYKGVDFSIDPRITFRAPTATPDPNAWQIEVRARDDKAGTSATPMTGFISMNPAHLQPDRVRVIGHELFHMFGDLLDMYMTPVEDAKGKRDPKYPVMVGRQDPKGRPDLRGITDPVVLKRWLDKGYITKAEFDRQSGSTAKVWQEELEPVLKRMGVMTPREFQMEQMAQQNSRNVRQVIEGKMDDNTIESLKLAEEAMRLEEEIADLRARLGRQTPKQTRP